MSGLFEYTSNGDDGYTSTAKGYASEAAVSASEAKTSAEEAKNSASNVIDSVNLATNASNSAQSSATSASASAQSANTSAEMAKVYALSNVYKIVTASVTNSYSIDLSQGSEFVLTLNNTQASLLITTPNTDKSVAQEASISLIQGTGSNLVTWPSNIKWANKTTPRLSYEKGQMDTITLTTLDGGATWIGIYIASGVE